MRVNSAFWVAIASSTGDQIPKPLGQAAVQETQTAITLDFLRRGKNPQHRYLLGVAQSYNSVKRFRDRVDVYLMRQNDDVGLTVSDNGIGIRPKLLPHAFERPQQGESGAARQHGGLGLGLGLAIAKQVVEMHLGKIQVVSPGEDHGTTFEVRLPLRAQPFAETTSGTERQDGRELNGLRVFRCD